LAGSSNERRLASEIKHVMYPVVRNCEFSLGGLPR
jgi:hypothetical protein